MPKLDILVVDADGETTATTSKISVMQGGDHRCLDALRSCRYHERRRLSRRLLAAPATRSTWQSMLTARGSSVSATVQLP